MEKLNSMVMSSWHAQCHLFKLFLGKYLNFPGSWETMTCQNNFFDQKSFLSTIRFAIRGLQPHAAQAYLHSEKSIL